MDKLKRLAQLDKLGSLPDNLQGGFLALVDRINDLSDKLKAIQGSLSDINTKEVRTYQDELETLVSGLQSLTQSVIDKDTIVNIPLDELSTQIKAVEVAIKAIKEVKIPEFPSEIAIDELQVNELLFAIQSIPEFPINDLQAMVDTLCKKIEAIKLEIPEQELFNYDYLDDKFKALIKAVKNISITVSSGGGSSVTRNTMGVQINPATEETLQSVAGMAIPKHDEIVLSYTGSDLTGVVYKLDTVTVATLTLSYVGGNLTGVIKS